MAERGDHLAGLRRADSTAKAARVRAALEVMVAAGEPPVVSLLARRAGVSRRFVYDHPELRAEVAHRAAQIADQQAGAVTASARTTTVSLRADLENARAANHMLEVDLTTLRRRLSQLMGREVLEEIGAETTPGATTRIAELEQALFDVQEVLVHRSEELESARQINRDLMARLNRGT
jgi:uncharacterized protein DUF6262